MSRRVFRYVPFTIERDETAELECAARCVSGDETECGAESGTYSDPWAVVEWQRKHTQETRHRRYRRSFGDYVVMQPPAELRELMRADEGMTLAPGGSTGGRHNPCEHWRLERRDGKTYCRDCKQQIYL